MEAIRLLEIAGERDPNMTMAHSLRAMVWDNVAYNRGRIDDRNPWDQMAASALYRDGLVRAGLPE